MNNKQSDLLEKPSIICDAAFHYEKTKSVLDFIVSILIIFPVMVIILIFGLLIKLESKGPIFFKQKRVGKNGKEFNIIKLRSMYYDERDFSADTKWTEVNDPRITKVGKLIRKFRIDELPQFFNVIKGDMSIIGPRPETPILTEEFSKDIKFFKKRLLVKPGISGLAQVNGGYEHTPQEKLSYDLIYIKNFSFKQDMFIFFKTIKVVVTGNGAR